MNIVLWTHHFGVDAERREFPDYDAVTAYMDDCEQRDAMRYQSWFEVREKDSDMLLAIREYNTHSGKRTYAMEFDDNTDVFLEVY